MRGGVNLNVQRTLRSGALWNMSTAPEKEFQVQIAKNRTAQALVAQTLALGWCYLEGE